MLNLTRCCNNGVSCGLRWSWTRPSRFGTDFGGRMLAGRTNGLPSAMKGWRTSAIVVGGLVTRRITVDNPLSGLSPTKACQGSDLGFWERGLVRLLNPTVGEGMVNHSSLSRKAVGKPGRILWQRLAGRTDASHRRRGRKTTLLVSIGRLLRKRRPRSIWTMTIEASSLIRWPRPTPLCLPST